MEISEQVRGEGAPEWLVEFRLVLGPRATLASTTPRCSVHLNPLQVLRVMCNSSLWTARKKHTQSSFRGSSPQH